MNFPFPRGLGHQLKKLDGASSKCISQRGDNRWLTPGCIFRVKIVVFGGSKSCHSFIEFTLIDDFDGVDKIGALSQNGLLHVEKPCLFGTIRISENVQAGSCRIMWEQSTRNVLAILDYPMPMYDATMTVK